MGTEVTAKLGLIITAKDEASQVFKAFAESLTGMFMGASGESKVLQESLQGITVAVNEAGKAARSAQEQFGTMAQASSMQFIGSEAKHAGKEIVGGLTEAVKSASEFQQSVDAIVATLNTKLAPTQKITTGQYKAMEDAALKMGQKGWFSANQIADGMYVMARQGIGYQDIMGGAMKSVQNLAVATDSDLSSTANVMSDIIHELGPSVAKLGSDSQTQFKKVADIVSGAMHDARMSMTDFMNTMKYVGPQAGALSLSLGGVSTAIAMLGQSGIIGSKAGTTLRTMLQDLTPHSKAAAVEMKKLGIITKDGGNKFLDAQGNVKTFAEIQDVLRTSMAKLTPIQQEAAIKTMFTQQSVSGMMAIVGKTKEEVADFTDAIVNHGDAEALAQQKWAGTAGKLRELSGHFATLSKEIGLILLPIVNKLIDVGEGLMTWFEKLSPKMKQTIVVIAALVGSFLLVTGTLLTFMATTKFLLISFSDLGNGAKGVGGLIGLMKSPIGMVVVAIVGLIAAGTWLYNNWDKVQALGKQLVQTYKDHAVLINTMGAVLAAFTTKALAEFLVKTAAQIAALGLQASAWIASKAQIIASTVAQVAHTAAQWAGQAATTAMTAAQWLLNIALDANPIGLVIIAIAALGAAVYAIIHYWTDITNAIKGAWDWLSKWINTKVDPKKVSVDTSGNHVGQNAEGTDNWRGGLTWVGEKGPELLNLPSGSQIMSNARSSALVNGMVNMGGARTSNSKSQVNNINITVNGNGKSGTQIGQDIAKQLRLQMPIVNV